MHTNIAIVGGGLVGSILAIALAQKTSYKITLIEAKAPAELVKQHALDTRTLALNYFSQQFLTELDLWPHLQSFACAINKVHISEQGAFSQTLLSAEDVDYPYLGSTVEINALQEVVMERLKAQKHINILQPATVTAIKKEAAHWLLDLQHDHVKQLSCDFLCAADSSDSPIRNWLNIATTQHDYQQSALVVTTQLAIDHQHIAYERFFKDGVMALLPLNEKRAGIVLVQKTAETKKLLALPDTELLAILQKKFGYRAGRFLALGKRQTYPLKMILAEQLVKDNAILLGNAAHTLNPIGAQGLNLGLRSVNALVNCFNQQGDLLQYEKQRLADIQRLKNISDGAAKIFANDFLPIKISRRLGLGILDTLSPLRRFFTRRMMGF